MPAEHIAFFFAAVTRAGLKAFHPDVFGPTHSTYNQLHRHLAVSTFQAIAGWYGYTALKVSLTVAQDYHLLCDMYDNFMFGTLCDRRYKEAKSKGYRKPILRLMKVKAVHSDDERIPGGDARKKKGLNICTKDGRNPIVTAFTRTVTVPPTGSSNLSRILPVGVPIDFFDPHFYNNELDIQEKAMYMKTGVAFPLAQFCNDANVDKWGKLSATEFMKQYGNDVLAQYKLPTPEELAAL
ncbi:hypothetical protein B0H14DRAFT_3640847, partial [Mycena olivaceomarginata]